MAWYETINHKVSSIFYQYGKLVARHRRKFLLCPLLAAAILSLGVLFLSFETDAIYLFTPTSSRARADMNFMDDTFPVSYDNYWPSRSLATQEKAGNLIITATDGGNILRDDILREILQLDENLQSMKVVINDTFIATFRDICAIVNGECLLNPLLRLLSFKLSSPNFNLTFPVTVLPQSGIAVFLGFTFGGVEVSNHNLLLGAQAFSMQYLLQSGACGRDNEALLWEEAFMQFVDSYNSSSTIRLSYMTSQSLSDELLAMTGRVMPLMVVTFSILFTFAVVSCLMSDWVQSKPWLGLLGLVSAFLAITSTVGLLSACGVAFNQVVASMPFLVIGIGIDDMFIMVAAWRHTSRRLSVEERMGLAYSDAAVSVTITSVTDALAFCIGAMTPLPAVRIFCLYAGVAIIFDYLYQITFFGACMVYTGQRESSGKHCFTCKKVLPRQQAPSRCYVVCCAGGISKECYQKNPDVASRQAATDGGANMLYHQTSIGNGQYEQLQSTSTARYNPPQISTVHQVQYESAPKTSLSETDSEQALTYFFRKYYAKFILSPPVKIIVVFLFCGYVAISVWGCLHVQEGLQLKDIFADDSYARKYYQQQTEYFTEYGATVSVAITTKQPYWENSAQRQVETLTRDFESARFIHGPQHTESWIRDFTHFLRASQNTTSLDRDTFMHLLQNVFLKMPEYVRYNQDIDFNDDNTNIESSRFIVMSTKVIRSADETQFMLEMRQKSDTAMLPVKSFSPTFILIEQYIIVVPNTVQNLLIATACMFVVALLLMPHPVCAVMVTVCIITIEIGVIGVMSLWKVKLDGISMINIILCIGFSVDFSAHMTYAFITSTGTSGNERAAHALHTLGTPIFLGGLSTILGISILSTSPAYIFRAFFRTMFLVMLFGLFHSLVFLPVLLSFLNPCLPRKDKPAPQTHAYIERIKTPFEYSPVPKSDRVERRRRIYSDEIFISLDDRVISLDQSAAKETVL